MEYIFLQSMPKYKKGTGSLPEWLAKLEDRFELGDIQEDSKKIKLCKLHVGQAGEYILNSLAPDTTWGEAKKALVGQMGEGSPQEEALTALQSLRREGKDLVELGGEAEKWARRAFPNDEGCAVWHAREAFVKALDKKLAYEVQKLGHAKLADVVTAARRLERLESHYETPPMGNLLAGVQEELRALIRKEVRESQVAAHSAVAAVHQTRVAVSHPGPGQPAPPPPLMSLPTYPPGTPGTYPGYAPVRMPQRGRGRPRCYLCNEENHLMRECPYRQEFRRWRQQATGAGGPPPAGANVGTAPGASGAPTNPPLN